MRTWISAAAVAAIGLSGGPALASLACGPWDGNQIRCIGNNGFAPSQPGGLSARDYTITVSPKATGKTGYIYSVSVWRSLCGFPGFLVNYDAETAHDEIPRPYKLTEHAPHLLCVEFFIHACRGPQYNSVPCQDLLNATIKEGDQ